MKYNYKKLDIDAYINSLYTDGLQKSKELNEEYVKARLEGIGIFKIKGYIKAFRGDLLAYSMDDVLYLYEFDRGLSLNLLGLISQIEIKLKTYLIETVYSLTDNPFFT